MHILWGFITFHSILELIDYLAMFEVLGWFSWLSWFFNSLRVGCCPFLEIHWEICKCFCVCLSLFNVSGFVPCFAFWFCLVVQKAKCGGIWCVSQPTLLRASEVSLTGASSKGEKCAESPPTFICGKCRKNRRKPVMKNILDSGVVFTFEEGISTSHVCPKGQQP